MMKRQEIITNIINRFESIGAGYYTSTGYSVYDWRVAPNVQQELPAILVRDTTCEINEGATAALHLRHLTVEIDGIGNSAEEARKILADVYKAIGVDVTWSGKAIKTVPVSDEINVEQEERKIASVSIKIIITYHSKGWEEI